MAETLFESALRRKDAGELGKACELFEASVAAGPSPHGWLQVGSCREPADAVGALEAFEAARASALHVDDPTRRNAYLSAAGERIDVLARRIPTVTFRASATPGAVAEITLAGAGVARPLDRYGEALRFNPGRYRVSASAPGFASFVLDLELLEGERRVITLPALASAPAASASPAAEVPFAPAAVAPPPVEAPPAFIINPLPVSLAAGGVVLVLSGIVVGQFSSSQRRRLERECEPPEDFTGIRRCNSSLAGTRERMADLALAADVLWFGGALLAATGVGLFILDQNRDESARVAVACAPSHCGLSALGHF